MLHVVEAIGSGVCEQALCGAPQVRDPGPEWLIGKRLTGKERMCVKCIAKVLGLIRGGKDLIHGWDEGVDHDLR